MTVRPGTVYLVGAGPGDPGLLTVRGQELLRRADVLVHDRLVSPVHFDEVRPSAEILDVGKAPGAHRDIQERINVALVSHARAGRVVVRLKGGDPLVFGRGWEEYEACRAAGVPCEIVPGVSSALAGPAAADIPVTLRGVASSVAIVAAPAADAKRLASVAHADTCVFLMGMRGLSGLVRDLIACGRDPSTPAAVVERATWPGQRTVRAPLDRIAEVAAAAGLGSPAIIVVGETARHAAPARPLTGRRVLVTRPRDAARELTQRLRELGAEVVEAPLIRVRGITPHGTDLAELAQRASAADWVVFTSRHGVRGLRRALESAALDVRALGRSKCAAVGPVAAQELITWGIRPDLVAEPARASALVAALLSQRPRRVLFPCGTLALDTVAAALGAAGIEVDRLDVYETLPVTPDEGVRTAVARGVDAVLLASPTAATALASSGLPLGDAEIICIGPATAAAAMSIGWSNVRIASEHSDAGLVTALLESPSPAGSHPLSESFDAA